MKKEESEVRSRQGVRRKEKKDEEDNEKNGTFGEEREGK